MAGHAIKLSPEVLTHLKEMREEKESYDSCLRRQFGLPTRKGYPQALRAYFIIDTPDALIIKRNKADARGEAILLSVKQGVKLSHKQKPAEVIEVRELP